MNLEENMLIAALGSSRDGIVVTDISTPKNEIVYANEAILNSLGYSERELQGLGTRFLLGKKTRPTAAHSFRRAINECIPCSITVSASKKDGSEIWIEISGAPILHLGRKTNYYVGICRDVTKRTEAMEALLSTDITIEAVQDRATEPTIDPVTSLYNRSYFEEYAEREWTTMLRQHLPMSIFMVQIKGIETLPESASDRLSQSILLELMADNLRQIFRRGTDLVARFDKLTFVGICAGMGWEEAEIMSSLTTDKINSALKAVGNDTKLLSCRVGLATAIPEEKHQVDDIVTAAQTALDTAMASNSASLHVADMH